jgi:hypothetical protein
MIKYRYAFDSKNKIIDVLELPKDRVGLDKIYTCISCGLRVIAKTKSDKRAKHFTHTADQQIQCSSETYLHKLGKAVFRETFIACLEQKQPFKIQLFHNAKCKRFSKLLNGVCESQMVEQSHDLTKLYDEIQEEQRDSSFIPDLLLTKRGNSSRRLYIEIAVTHTASAQKRESGNRIIEIVIGSENDLEKIRQRNLSQEDEKVQFINFDPKPVFLSDSECLCVSEKWHLFRVFSGGNCHMSQLSPTKIEAFVSGKKNSQLSFKINTDSAEKVIWWQVMPFESIYGSTYVDCIHEANKAGVPIRSCFVCRYGARNDRWDNGCPVFCRFLKLPCKSTKAVQCEFYRREIGKSIES